MRGPVLAAMASSVLLTGCGGKDEPTPPPPIAAGEVTPTTLSESASGRLQLCTGVANASVTVIVSVRGPVTKSAELGTDRESCAVWEIPTGRYEVDQDSDTLVDKERYSCGLDRVQFSRDGQIVWTKGGAQGEAEQDRPFVVEILPDALHRVLFETSCDA